MDLEEELGQLKSTDIALVIAETDKYQQVNSRILNYLVNDQALGGVYVTVNKPYMTIKAALADSGIDTSHIFFIDAISEDTGMEDVDATDAVFLESPQDLTDISIAVSQALESLPDDSDAMLILQNLDALMMYNDEDTVSRFAHHLTGKLRDHSTRAVLVMTGAHGGDEAVGRFGQFADKTVRLDD